MTRWDTVAIVGVGLIGGSIGLALRQRGLCREVVGIGRRAESLRAAEQYGTVSRSTLDLAAGVARADLIVICTPVGQITEHARAIASACRPDALITDAGSSKQQIVRELEFQLARGTRFIGSHPLAGSEKRGPAEADGNLLVDRMVVITPTELTARADAESVREFWSSLGARTCEMSPEAHDAAIAITSHCPHVVAAALASTAGPSEAPLIASGWRDTTRIASGDPALWVDILLSNRGAVTAACQQFQQELSELCRAIDAADERALFQLLEKAKRSRDAVAN
jgi:prephenate dehydrogenase